MTLLFPTLDEMKLQLCERKYTSKIKATPFICYLPLTHFKSIETKPKVVVPLLLLSTL